MKNRRTLSLTAKIILYLIPFIVFIVFIVFLSYQYYERVKENRIDDTCSIFREIMDNLVYKYINLSEDIVLYSRILSESPSMQELLQESKARWNTLGRPRAGRAPFSYQGRVLREDLPFPAFRS
ncbi:MAG: hypothetical protein AB2L14_36570 [Candidatus Xenobiia bacterium LiM19]